MAVTDPEKLFGSSENLFSGRRSFDRQLELLVLAVNTLQRDFVAVQERLAGVQTQMRDLNSALQAVENQAHKMDKALVARLATITVAERVLWLVVATLIGIGAKLFG